LHLSVLLFSLKLAKEIVPPVLHIDKVF